MIYGDKNIHQDRNLDQNVVQRENLTDGPLRKKFQIRKWYRQ